MPTVKQSVGIATAIAMMFAAATAFGIGAVEHSATQVSANRVTPARLIYGSLIISGLDNFWALNGP